MQHSSRLNLPRPNLPGEGASDSPVDLPQLFHDRDTILDLLTKSDHGPLSSRPVSTSGSPGDSSRFFIVTDQADSPRLDWDFGTGWITLARSSLRSDPTKFGSSIIAASETRVNAAYGLMPTADRVDGLVLPAGGFIEVNFFGVWSEQLAGTARAAIFLNATQVQGFQPYYLWPVGMESQFQSDATPAQNQLLLSQPGGLISNHYHTGAIYAGDVGTGQVMAGLPDGASEPTQIVGTGGPCRISADPGTYSVSVRLKASSGGAVTMSHRRLYCEVKS